MRRHALRDDQWDRIKDLLPGREGHVGVTATDNRLFVECSATRMLAGSRQVDGRSLRVIKMALLVLSDKENIACYCESGWAGCPG